MIKGTLRIFIFSSAWPLGSPKWFQDPFRRASGTYTSPFFHAGVHLNSPSPQINEAPLCLYGSLCPGPVWWFTVNRSLSVPQTNSVALHCESPCPVRGQSTVDDHFLIIIAQRPGSPLKNLHALLLESLSIINNPKPTTTTFPRKQSSSSPACKTLPSHRLTSPPRDGV